MHKEAALTKLQKEEIKGRNMIQRDNFEGQNLGGFRKSFPNNDPVSAAYLLITVRICKADLSTSSTTPSTNGTRQMAPSPAWTSTISLTSRVPAVVVSAAQTLLAIRKLRHSIWRITTRKPDRSPV